jgi:hypothetical protein
MVERMRITGDGKVGIGTGAPQFPLDVNGYMRTSVMPLDDITQAMSGLHFSNRGAGGGEYRWSFLMASPGGASGVSPNGLELYEYPGPNAPRAANAMARVIFRKASSTVIPAPFVIDGLGHVGIGVWSPDSYALDVSGSVHVSGNALFSGTVTGANIQANYQDVAEWVPASESMTAGTVVVIDPAARNGVKPSSRSYDTGVAGVVSAQPGVLLGQAGDAKEKIATTGRVKVRVDASRAAIAAGDLLVTSDKPGVAMRSEPVDVAGIKMHRPGTLIGKALEPLKEGTAEILVLLSLQ